ncbi:unnamed protein product, partial [Brassica napus]
IAASLFQNVHTSALTARGESQLCKHYSISVVKSQQCFKGKMAQFQFQERMNRCLMVCQDKFEASKLHKNMIDAPKIGKVAGFKLFVHIFGYKSMRKVK